MKKVLLSGVVVLLLCACNDKSASSRLISLQNQSFVIQKLELAGKTLTPSALQDENSSISFDNTSYNGFAACNNFFGSFSAKNGKIHFNADGGATKMMCPPDIMAFEDDLLANLYGEFTLDKENESIILQSNKIKIYLVPKK